MAVARATGAFEFVKGEDAQINWTIYTSSALAAAQDITGWTLEVIIKRKASDSGATQVTSTTSLVTAASGLAKTVLASADTASLDGDYDYDLWRTDSGSKTCLSSGTISFIDTPRY